MIRKLQAEHREWAIRAGFGRPEERSRIEGAAGAAEEIGELIEAERLIRIKENIDQQLSRFDVALAIFAYAGRFVHAELKLLQLANGRQDQRYSLNKLDEESDMAIDALADIINGNGIEERVRVGLERPVAELKKDSKDALGDTQLFLVDFCNVTGCDLQSVTEETWEIVRKR